jgi:UDP:flavonoid glycosyltransferase YjiC (YdhE family)
MTHVLLATVGSLGDLNPLLAIGVALRRSDVDVSIAANPVYREVSERSGLRFVPMGLEEDPTQFPVGEGPANLSDDAVRYIDHAVFRQFDRLFTDLYAAADADVIVASYFLLPAHLVAEKLHIPYIACALSPAYLVPTHCSATNSNETSLRRAPAAWHARLGAMRAKYGLPRIPLPFTAVLTSPIITLGLFPRFLMPPSIHAAVQLQVVGYPACSHPGKNAVEEALRSFCDERTVVFSFGTHVDRNDARYIFEESVAACRQLGLKCLYLSRWVSASTSDYSRGTVLLRAFASLEAIFPLVGMIVHHGGIGTLMTACSNAKPMVIVPFRHDQPYHAARMMDVANTPTIPAANYNRNTLAVALSQALAGGSMMQQRITASMAGELDGAQGAIQAILSVCDRAR